nr:hypothetical protein [Campylobacter sp.]
MIDFSLFSYFWRDLILLHCDIQSSMSHFAKPTQRQKYSKNQENQYLRNIFISKIKKVLFFGFCLNFWRNLVFYKLNLLTNTANLVQICRKFGLNLIKFYDFAMQINLINKFKLNSANLRF